MRLDFFKNSKKTLDAHFSDFRNFVLLLIFIFSIIFFTCFYFAKDIYNFLASSLLASLESNNIDTKFIITDVTEVFFSHLKLSFYVAFTIFVPLFLFALFIFLRTLVKRKTRKIATVIIILIPLLFGIGVSFAYYVGIKFIWDFFINFSLVNTDIKFLPTVSEYIGLVLNIILIFGLSFELPVVLLLLNLINIINENDILRFGKYAIVGAFIIGAIFTPPDPISQILIAMLLILLYYLSYYLLKFINKM